MRRLPNPLKRLLHRPDPSDRLHIFAAEFVCRRPDGSVEWREPATGYFVNRAFNEGEKVIGEDFFRQQVYGALAGVLYGRLYNDTPTDTDQLADLTGEPASNGYQPIPWSRNNQDWGAPTAAGTEPTVRHEWLGVKKTFIATGAGWGPVQAFVFATTSDNSGKPVGWFVFSQPRTVPGGQGLDVQPRGMLRGVTN